jgi:TatD DNase family protein
VIVHTREADEATLRVLDETPWRGEGLRGVIHCYTGGPAFAAELLARRFAISFSGIVTFAMRTFCARARRSCRTTVC